MPNINRDYLCILDVKTGAINAPKMYFYNTDRSTSNIYVQLVVKETIVSATPIENATDFVIEAKIVKPNGFVKEMTGQLVNEADAIYEFDLPEDFTDLTGINQVEFWVRARVSDREERITSASTKYTVKGSILNSIDDDIEDDNDYPIFLALMERVERLDKEVTEVSLATKALNEESKGELAKIKADEVEIANNEAIRQAQEAAREYSEDTRGANESRRIQAEADREANEQQRIANENDRIYKEDRRESQERDRVSNEYDRQNAEQSREYAEMDRADAEQVRQTNEANRVTAEEIRRTNEEARIAEHETFRTEQQAMKTELDEVKAENAILMENDKKQADRMTQIEISDKRQYVIMEGLMNSAGDGYLKIEDTGNDTTLYNSVEGFVDVKNITGNTMVNSIKNSDDEFTLNADINTSGQSVTLTTAVDNGQVDVLAEGNTMVNVCDQQDPVAITKSYTVETGNHIALQGEYDGKARPVPTGNTLVNCVTKIENFTLPATITSGQRLWYHSTIMKPSTTYTVIVEISKNTDTNNVAIASGYQSQFKSIKTIDLNATGRFMFVTTTLDNSICVDNDRISSVYCSNGEVTIENIIILEGDYTNKPIPDYFTGMQSSFEDKLVPENLITPMNDVKQSDLIIDKDTFRGKLTVANMANKPIYFETSFIDTGAYRFSHKVDSGQVMVFELTDNTNTKFRNIGYHSNFNWTSNDIEESKKVYIVEGDYTNYDFSDYDPTKAGKYRVDYKVTGKNKFDINGVFSSNISTYPNLPNGTSIVGNTISMKKGNSGAITLTYPIKVEVGKSYTISCNITCEGNNMNYPVRVGDVKNDYDLCYVGFDSVGFKQHTFVADDEIIGIKIYCSQNQDNFSVSNIQLEEGSTATAYEPYKEQVKTYYLNSPLLEGDTIEDNGNNVVHVHRYGKVVLDGSGDEIWSLQLDAERTNSLLFQHPVDNLRIYTNGYDRPNIISNNFSRFNHANLYDWDVEGISNTKDVSSIRIRINKSKLSTKDVSGFKQWLRQNPTTIVYQLQTPTYELISQSDTILTDSYIAGHLDFDTAVPVEKVVFRSWATVLKYLYPSIDYLIQFEADNNGIIYRSGSDFIVSKGINKMTFTTDSNPLTTLGFNGIGFNASNIVVTEATDKDFGYFQGMKSVGELEENKIEILSSNKNLVDWSTLKTYGIKDTDIVQNDDNGFIFRATSWNVGVKLYADIKCFCKNSYYKLSTLLPDGADKICPLSNILYVDNNENVLGTVNYNSGIIYTDNIPANTKYLRLFFKNYTNDGTKTNGITSVQIEKVSDSSGTNTDYIPHASNKKQILLNEPLRAVGDTKDRFVQIDGKWYVERNTKQFTINGSELGWNSGASEGDTTNGYGIWNTWFAGELNIRGTVSPKCDKLNSYNASSNVDGMSNFILTYSTGLIVINIKGATSKEDVLNWLSVNPLTIVAKLETPTYEPVEISPTVNTYTDVTHITNNSTIPMNMPIVNSGYEIIAKPSTKYTVVGMTNGRIGDSTIVNGTITTPATLDDPFLRPYGTGKTSKVMLLEGEPTNIPGYFKGIKSVFEDKVTEDGKYACKVRVYNDLGNETVQTLYLDEPLYNTNNITIYNDKLGYWKNWDKAVLNGNWNDDGVSNHGKRIATTQIRLPKKCSVDSAFNASFVSSRFLMSTEPSASDIKLNSIRLRYSGNSYYFNAVIPKYVTDINEYMKDLDIIYQLAEPEFIPLIDNCPNFVIGSWDNCSIHFDSIIPLSATRYRYTGNVPSVVAMSDDVAETKSISDEQDAMIVDLATEVAVMEMMLM